MCWVAYVWACVVWLLCVLVWLVPLDVLGRVCPDMQMLLDGVRFGPLLLPMCRVVYVPACGLCLLCVLEFLVVAGWSGCVCLGIQVGVDGARAGPFRC